jgi:ATP-dependent DNA ligase
MFGSDLLDRLPTGARARLRRRAQPKWVAPMLATLTNDVFSRQGWLFEPKWDGERCIAFRRGRDLDLFSRNQIRLNAKYPEVIQAIYQQEATYFIADGEIVAFDGLITSFAKLQARMQVKRPSTDLIRKVPVWFYLFDLLYLDRYDIRQVPLRYRKQVLRKAFDFHDALRFTEHRATEGEDYYRQACRTGWEGIIAKKADSVYVSRRTRDWLKFKCKQEQEFVIGGYTDPRGTRSGVRSIAAGLPPRWKARVCR